MWNRIGNSLMNRQPSVLTWIAILTLSLIVAGIAFADFAFFEYNIGVDPDYVSQFPTFLLAVGFGIATVIFVRYLTNNLRWYAALVIAPILMMVLSNFPLAWFYLAGVSVQLKQLELNLDEMQAWQKTLPINRHIPREEWPKCVCRMHPKAIYTNSERSVVLQFAGDDVYRPYWIVLAEGSLSGDDRYVIYSLGQGAYLYAKRSRYY